MQRISIVIPSRLQAMQGEAASPWFVERAIRCVRDQSIFRQGFTPQILIGVDPGMAALGQPRLGSVATLCEAEQPLQSSALNAAGSRIDGDVVAFLEDDDLWEPTWLERAVRELRQFAFVSSTQLERTVDGVVVKILDYPTPSSWVMRRSTWDRVGAFDPSYRWHLDSDWMGRLNATQLPRLHFVEATAPIDYEAVFSTRIRLGHLIECAGDSVSFLRHESPWPLILRTVHPGSGMAQIARDTVKFAESHAERLRLQAQYGTIPW